MSEDNPPVSTGSGDDGTTTLLGGGRLAKDDERIALLGDIDEASTSMGLARAEAEDGEIEELLMKLQRLLYRIMADVGMPKGQNAVGAEDVKVLDEALENWRARTQIPDEFVVPGKNKLGAHLDFARSVVRRVERGMVTVDLVQDHPDAVEAVNRLSDLLFVVARNAEGKSTPSKG
ncbi:MAG: cob(I)yrinic acid a,c-diamide adenosyltransferase [Rubrobacter sp.]|nr:cob(I)yrinic acid a,c-diamide adenosyltransferase [Rubrobacter sp.]